MSQINDSNRFKSRNRRHEEHSNGKAYSGKVLKKPINVVIAQNVRQTVTTRKIWKTSNKVHVSGNCDDICYTRTESKVHIHTCHEVITR